MRKVTSPVSAHVAARMWWWRGLSASTSNLARRGNTVSTLISTLPTLWPSTNTSTERQVALVLTISLVIWREPSPSVHCAQSLSQFFIRTMTKGGISLTSFAWHLQENLSGMGLLMALRFSPSLHWDLRSSSWRTMCQRPSCILTGLHTGADQNQPHFWLLLCA